MKDDFFDEHNKQVDKMHKQMKKRGTSLLFVWFVASAVSIVIILSLVVGICWIIKYFFFT